MDKSDTQFISVSPYMGNNGTEIADIATDMMIPSTFDQTNPHIESSPSKLLKFIISGTRKNRIGSDPLSDLNPEQEKLLDDIVQRKKLRTFCFAAPIKTYELKTPKGVDLLELSALKLLYEKGASLASLGITLQHRLVLEDLTGTLIYEKCDLNPEVIPAYRDDLIALNALLAESYGAQYVTIECESDLLESFHPGYRSQHLNDFHELSYVFFEAGQDIMFDKAPDLSAYVLPSFNFDGFTKSSLSHYQSRLLQNQHLHNPFQVICDFFLCAMLRHRYGFHKMQEQVDMKMAFSFNPQMPKPTVGIPPVICRSNWFRSRHKENNLPFWTGVSVLEQVNGKLEINAYPLRLLPEGASQCEVTIHSGEKKCLLTPYIQSI